MLNNQTGLKRLIFAHAVTGGELPPITEYTATGNPATFSTNLIRPLQSFEIPFTPVQSGSGDPSPSNVRPISGWSGITITANGETIMVLLDANLGVVYGGTLDAVTGVLTVEWGMIDLGSLTWITNTDGGGNLYRSVTTRGILPNTNWMSGVVEAYCPIYSPRTGNDTYLGTDDFSFAADATGQIYVYDSSRHGLTADEFKASIDGVKVVYRMITPQTIQLTPVQVRTIIGQNSISASNNGTNTIKYLKRG